MMFTVSGPVASSTPGSTFVEGVGDEIIFFLGFSVLLILLAVAWFSTSVGDRNGVIRAAILVIERSRRRPRRSSDRRHAVGAGTRLETPAAATVSGGDGDGGGDSIARMSDAADTNPDVDEEISPCAVDDRETVEKELNTAAVEGDTARPSSDDDTVSEEQGQIRVRLKFLNDTLKQVDARLEDQLGHFKRRHFGDELDENKVVRLIFNGQLLHRDQETLLHYGLFDNCVVHCHISASGAAASNSASATQPSSEGSRLTSPGLPPPMAELDLSRLMLPLFGLILGLFWAGRIQYKQYFNATSTFALLCISGLFVFSVVAICMPTRTRHP